MESGIDGSGIDYLVRGELPVTENPLIEVGVCVCVCVCIGRCKESFCLGWAVRPGDLS